MTEETPGLSEARDERAYFEWYEGMIYIYGAMWEPEDDLTIWRAGAEWGAAEARKPLVEALESIRHDLAGPEPPDYLSALRTAERALGEALAPQQGEVAP